MVEIKFSILYPTSYYSIILVFMTPHPNIANLQEGEQIQMVIRRHWIVFTYVFVYIFTLILSTAFVLFFRDSISTIIPDGLLNVILVIYWTIFLLVIYVTWINNELDLIIITNMRVIGIDQIAFLHRDFSECAIERVQEINAETKGLLADIFNFGTLTIHTASDASDFIMHATADPLETARGGLNIIQKFKHSSTGTTNRDGL